MVEIDPGALVPQVALVDPVARLAHVGHLEPRTQLLEPGRPRVGVAHVVTERERVTERDDARLAGRNLVRELRRVAKAARVRRDVEAGPEHVSGDAARHTRPAELGVVHRVRALGQRAPPVHAAPPDEVRQARGALEQRRDERDGQQSRERASCRARYRRAFGRHASGQLERGARHTASSDIASGPVSGTNHQSCCPGTKLLHSGRGEEASRPSARRRERHARLHG